MIADVDMSEVPLWAWPIAAAAFLCGLVVALGVSFYEGAALAGETPVDRWARWRFLWHYAVTWVRELVRR